MSESLAERLRKAAGSGARMADYDGRTITIVAIETEPSPFKKGELSVKALAEVDGEQVAFYTTPTAGRQLAEIEDLLPTELKVESFPGQFGKTGYKFVEAS